MSGTSEESESKAQQRKKLMDDLQKAIESEEGETELVSEGTDADRLTVTLDEFECRCCANTTNSTTLSYEDGRWVHNRCGGRVEPQYEDRADELVAQGEGRYDHAERAAEAFRGAVGPMLDGDDDE